MQENTKTKDQTPKTENRLTWILFALVIVFTYFFGLSIPLLGPDEPRYAQVAREMFERNDWITPTLGGFDWFEKPALLYWLQIASYKLFGVSEFAARFGSALFGLGTILSLWILGKKWSEVSGRWAEEDPKSQIPNPKSDFANWLALIAASSIGLLAFSRGASFDIILTFPITASLVGFFVWEISRRAHAETPRENDKISPLSATSAGLFSFYFFIGVALVAKGLVGIVFPFAIVAFYYVLSRRFPPKTFLISLFWGTVLSLLVAAAWYLPMYMANGWKFVDEFFIQHHFQRYTSNKYLHPQPFWFFFVVLPLMTVPWLPFFFASVWNLVKNILRREKSETPDEEKTLAARRSSLITFAVAWLVVPLVFFSASGSKLPGYILPALPAAVILTADYVYGFVGKSNARRLALQLLAFLTFVFAAVAVHFFVDDFARHDTVKNLVSTANENGYREAKILTLHTISHNLEFYGAGRLARLADGKQRYFYGVAEVKEFIEQNGGKPVLVLVPLERLKELTETDLVAARVLGDNGEKALLAVNLK